MQLPYTFRKVSRQLTEEDLHAFEVEQGINLPPSYRTFLVGANGGYPKNQVYCYEDGKSFVLQRLYPLTDEIEPYFNLRSINHPGNGAPKGFITIGTSSFGDPVCLGVSPPHAGKIIFLDHEERDPDEIEENDWLGVYVLADSFEFLMSSLQSS